MLYATSILVSQYTYYVYECNQIQFTVLFSFLQYQMQAFKEPILAELATIQQEKAQMEEVLTTCCLHIANMTMFSLESNACINLMLL